jgi:VWFA-related protein
MRWSFRTAVGAALLAVVVLGVRSGAQQPAQQPSPDAGAQPPPQPAPQGDQQQPTFRAGINFVRLDVIISAKNGSPIEDLKQSDFQVYEDGKPQAIQTFKLIELNGGTVPEPGTDGPPRPIRTDADEAAEAARDDVRVFAVFLDDYHVRRESSMRVRAMLADFVASKLGPSDMIGLMYPLQPLGTVRLTRDHDAVERGLMDFTGRKYDYEPTNDFEQRYVMYSPETVERIRNDVSLSALEALIVHLGGLKEGRKSLLLVSEGYSNMLPPQLRGDGATPAIVGVDPLSPGADPLAGQNDPIEERASWYASNEMQDELRYIWDVANKNNVSIYAIDPRGLATSEFDIKDNVGQQLGNDYLHTTQDTLRTLAEETDGRAIINANDLTPGLNQIVRDSSAYYLIGYDSAAAPTDGKFHKIEVRVDRPGVQVRARQGYWAITKENAERVLAPAKPGPPPGVSKALAVVAEPLRERVIQSWIGTSRGDAGKTRVSFVWQAAPRPGARNDDAPAAVTLMALGDDGTPLYRGRVPSTTPAAGTGTAAGPGRVSFDVPPGLMHLRITVESADQGTLDSEIRDVDVPDLTTADAVLGTPVVYRARTARQMADLKTAADPVPAIGHEFNRAERLLIRVPIYGAAPPLSARLLNQAGDAMEAVDVEAPAAAGSTAQIELPLASLAPGDYVLEISAKADPNPIVQYVGFRVGG